MMQSCSCRIVADIPALALETRVAGWRLHARRRSKIRRTEEAERESRGLRVLSVEAVERVALS
jgi:hypothetical protein